MMPTSTTEIANAIITPKDGHSPRFAMARSKPFVFSSVSTKRYAPSKQTPGQKPPPIPPPTSIKERSSVSREVPTKQVSRPGYLPNVVPKAELRRALPKPKPTPAPAPSKATKVQKSLPLPLVPTADGYLPEKTSVHKSLKTVRRLKEDKLVGRFPVPAPATRRPTQVTTADELSPRPSCVPRACVYRSSVGAMKASQGNQDATVKVSAAGPRNPGIAGQRPSVSLGTAKTVGKIVGRFNAPDISVKKPVVAGDCRIGTPTRNQRLTAPKPIVYPQAVISMSDDWSPPPSPDLSSFPSQSWTIVVDTDAAQIKTPTKICSDETCSSISDAPKLGVIGMPNDSCGSSEAVSSPLSLSPSSTVIETLESPAKPTVGLNGMVMISSPTKGPSAEISHAVCTATIVSPSRDGTTSIATLAKVMDRSQFSSTQVSDPANGTLKTVRCAMEIASNLFAPSRPASLSSTKTAVAKPMGTNVSRIRKLFIPPLDKDVNVSKNPMTQMEIETLRAQKRVAGGGVVDARLDRLGSLTAMAIVTKRLGMSGSDSPS